MRKWRISVQWELEVEAEDEGYALMQADSEFSLMSDARCEELEPDEQPAP